MSQILLNLGSVGGPLPGHLNVGFTVGSDFDLEPRRGLPLPDASVSGIVSERYLESQAPEVALALLRECRRVLVPEGRLRVVAQAGPGAEALERFAATVGLEVRDRRPTSEGDPVGVSLEFGHVRRPPLRPGEALVSIVLPAYNPAFFRECLESALTQTYPNLEIIVSDDCPGEGIHEIVRPHLECDPRIRYRRNRPSLGALANFVDSFRIARGEYIKFMNDDDSLHPTCVARMAEVLDRHPGVTEVTSHRQAIDEQGRFLPDLDGTRRVVSRDSRIDGRIAVDTVLSRSFNFIGHPTAVLFRRGDVADIAPHLFCLDGCEFPWSGDLALSVNLLSRGDLVYLVDTLSYVRIQGDQLSQKPEVIRGLAREWPIMRHHGARMGFLVPGASVKGGVRALHPPAGPDPERGIDPAVFHPAAAPLAIDGLRAVSLLCVPDWSRPAWKELFLLFLRTFGPADPVSLVLRMEPAEAEAACRLAEAAMREAGVSPDRAPDVVLEASEILPGGRGGIYTAVSALLSSPGTGDARLHAEARACERLVVEPASSAELRAVVAALLASTTAGEPVAAETLA